MHISVGIISTLKVLWHGNEDPTAKNIDREVIIKIADYDIIFIYIIILKAKCA